MKQHSIELLSLFIAFLSFIIAFLALIISNSAKFYTVKTFSLSLLDKRYRLYYDFTLLINNLVLHIDKATLKASLYEHLNKVKFLLWEAQYIFEDDIHSLLTQIKEHISGTILYFGLSEDMAHGFVPEAENYKIINKQRVQHYDPLLLLVSNLLGNDEKVNLNSYFRKYLADKDLKKPLPMTFLDCCKKCISK